MPLTPQYWELNLGPNACWANTLLLNPAQPSFYLFIFLSFQTSLNEFPRLTVNL